MAPVARQSNRYTLPKAGHGSRSAYTWGCRCDRCRAANTAYYHAHKPAPKPKRVYCVEVRDEAGVWVTSRFLSRLRNARRLAKRYSGRVTVHLGTRRWAVRL